MMISVHQPQYLPWAGYFHKIYQSDAFVFLDNVQYKKGEYQNRNRLRTNDGWMWLTVPVLNERSYPVISDVCVDNSQDWRRRHWRALCVNYAKAPYFKQYSGFFEETYKREWVKLVDLNIHIIRYILEALGIDTPIYFESNLGIKTTNTARIIEICKILKADSYLSGAGGRAYLDEALFGENGIRLIYQDFKHPEYEQRRKPFTPFMSIVDLLFNHGEDSLSILSEAWYTNKEKRIYKGEARMEKRARPIANPLMVLREEFDDWAVLFNPDTGDAFGLNPVSVFIWKHLDGSKTVEDIIEELRLRCENVPDDADRYVRAFIEDLMGRGMAGYELCA